MHNPGHSSPTFLPSNSLNKCTYTKTDKRYAVQYWKTCYDCFNSDSEGACLNCIAICHNNHKIGPLERGNFFCDCGESGLCNLLQSSKKHSKMVTVIKPNMSGQFGKINRLGWPNRLDRPNHPIYLNNPNIMQQGSTMTRGVNGRESMHSRKLSTSLFNQPNQIANPIVPKQHGAYSMESI